MSTPRTPRPKVAEIREDSPETRQARIEESGLALRRASRAYLEALTRYSQVRRDVYNTRPEGWGSDLPSSTAELGLLTQAALARRAGVVPAVVTKAIKEGRIHPPEVPAPPGPQRYYLPEEADRLVRVLLRES